VLDGCNDRPNRSCVRWSAHLGADCFESQSKSYLEEFLMGE
jgi:hypothetical protein